MHARGIGYENSHHTLLQLEYGGVSFFESKSAPSGSMIIVQTVISKEEAGAGHQPEVGEGYVVN